MIIETLQFDKLHGAGNDFVVLNGFTQQMEMFDAKCIKQLCHRHFGIGADGVIIIKPSQNSNFYMEYYNSDGQKATMCGNGGRVSVAYAHMKGIITDHSVTFYAADGIHAAQILKIDNVFSSIALQLHVREQISRIDENTFFIDTGSPHLCRFVKDIESIDVLKEGNRLRYSSLVPESGANINFIQIINNGIFVRTYERGVENETLSCGTGVVASALSFATLKKRHGVQSLHVYTNGGNLEVDFNSELSSFKDIWLTGPVKYVYNGIFLYHKE